MKESNNESVETTCPYCGVGCGLVIQREPRGKLNIRGDESHPANHGRLCSKGAALLDTVGLEGRLLYPMIQGKRADWDAALDFVAKGFRDSIETYGPDAVAFYVSGQLLTEDYYVANKLMKGFIGSGNIDTNARLCMSSAVAGYKRAFGTDTVPCSYTDLEQAELIVLTGTNTAWCHPVLFQRIRAAKLQRQQTKIVVIDPRRTPTCDIADLHLPLRPGSDAILFNGLLNYLRHENTLDWEFLERHTEGFTAALTMAKSSADNIPAVAADCELDPEAVARFFRLFAMTNKTVTLFSQGIHQSSSGTDKVNSIVNCHLATGRIGKPGCGPFSITGQPNAMGCREIGGLANSLAAHMGFEQESVDCVGRFWDSTCIATKPGLNAIDLFNAIMDGEIKALWIMGTNPMVSLPDADDMKAALMRCAFVVTSDCVARTDTTLFANVLLPAAAWGEKEGTVTNAERRISRQRAFLPVPGEAKPDWWIVSEVAKRMGFKQAFSYQSPVAIFREHARLSGFENTGSRYFDIGELSQLTDETYANLQPVQWPLKSSGQEEPTRPFGNGAFFTPSRKAKFVAVAPILPENPNNDKFPLTLNTGRVRDHWHSMTRTGKSPRLSAHTFEPLLHIHPADARRHHVKQGQLARVFSCWGETLGRVEITEDQRPGSVFLPIHWNNQFASCARTNSLVNPVTDPISGEPEFKHTPVRITHYQPAWYGCLLTRDHVHLNGLDYWVVSKGERFWRYELAGDRNILRWPEWARKRLGSGGEWLEFEDLSAGRYRGVRLEKDKLVACLFVSRSIGLPPRSWLAELFATEELTDADRVNLLAGTPPKGHRDAGDRICSCFGVGSNDILNAIKEKGLYTPEAIGRELLVGTNCGSCVSELQGLIERARTASVAA